MSKINQKRFDEYFTKVVLEYCFPERYHDLEVKDKPDLQGKGVGVEVTNCTPPSVREGVARCRRVRAAGKFSTNRDLERIKQLRAVQITARGIVWDQGCYSEDLNKSPLKNILNAVKNKLEKLNSATTGYAECEHYDLFVNSALDIDTGDLKIKLAILEELQKLNTKLKKFDKIYLLVINKTMIVFDLVNNIFEVKYLYNRLDVLAQQAIKLIREG